MPVITQEKNLWKTSCAETISADMSRFLQVSSEASVSL